MLRPDRQDSAVHRHRIVEAIEHMADRAAEILSIHMLRVYREHLAIVLLGLTQITTLLKPPSLSHDLRNRCHQPTPIWMPRPRQGGKARNFHLGWIIPSGVRSKIFSPVRMREYCSWTSILNLDRAGLVYPGTGRVGPFSMEMTSCPLFRPKKFQFRYQ